MVEVLDVKQAAEKATQYLAALLPATDIRLEEVEISDDERYWHITLSALVPAPQAPRNVEPAITALGSLFHASDERVYKTLTVDATNGTVRSMKIRTLHE